MALIPNLITAAPARMSHSDAAQMKSKHARKVPICIFVKKAARKGKSGAKFREVVYYHVLSGKFKGTIRPKVVAVNEKPRNGMRKMGKFRVVVTDQVAKVHAVLRRYSAGSDDDRVLTQGVDMQMAHPGNDDAHRAAVKKHMSALGEDPFSEQHAHVKEHLDREEATTTT